MTTVTLIILISTIALLAAALVFVGYVIGEVDTLRRMEKLNYDTLSSYFRDKKGPG